MSDPQDEQAPVVPADDTVLGTIPTGPRDTTLGAHPAPDAGDDTPAAPAPIDVPLPPEPAAAPQPSADDEHLTLPHGGLVAMRKSGGFKFSSQTIVVYDTGRVAYTSSRHTSHIKPTAQPRLSNQRMLGLRRVLTEARLPQATPAVGRQGPDTFVYEIVARVGRKLRTAEAFEGSIPASLEPLIRELRQLMPTAE